MADGDRFELERRRRAFGARIRGLRAAAGLSGPKLAASSGVAQSQISRVERGQTTPHEAVIADLLDALDVPVLAREEVLSELRAIRAEIASRRLFDEFSTGRPVVPGSIEDAIAADGTLSDDDKRYLLMTLAYVRHSRNS